MIILSEGFIISGLAGNRTWISSFGGPHTIHCTTRPFYDCKYINYLHQWFYSALGLAIFYKIFNQ